MVIIVTDTSLQISIPLQCDACLQGALLEERIFEQWKNGFLPKIQGT